jgi:hypothetical protein
VTTMMQKSKPKPKPKPTSGPKPKTKTKLVPNPKPEQPDEAVGIDPAFQLVLKYEPRPHKAAALLTKAIHEGVVRLWWGDAIAKPDFAATNLRVVARVAADGRVSAEIVATWNLEEIRVSTVSRNDVVALVKSLRPLKHPGGSKRVYSHEHILMAAAVYLQARCKPQPPTSTELENAVALILEARGDDCPSESHLGEILRPLCEWLKAGLDPEIMKVL